ncbi:hypothetical protein DW663_01265 [Fusobacterium mortiferum]|uniref:Uncharacterized protein n=1 Tax=Fusobacterium mortiferum TaxID=850 RepID=A0A414Q2L9_FUSMR|nr:hypothetical protein [Fusobacterium mortiferum]RHF75050.1 hypothetical protein DW663_01265 [Fusobacterium mortiferum]
MNENIVFSKKEILNQFTTEELILELVTRDGKYLNDFFEAFIGSSILLRTHTKFTEDFKSNHVEEVKKILENLKAKKNE